MVLESYVQSMKAIRKRHTAKMQLVSRPPLYAKQTFSFAIAEAEGSFDGDSDEVIN